MTLIETLKDDELRIGIVHNWLYRLDDYVDKIDRSLRLMNHTDNVHIRGKFFPYRSIGDALMNLSRDDLHFLFAEIHASESHNIDSGIEFIKTLRTTAYKGVIISFCDWDMYHRYAALKAGADDYIFKPLSKSPESDYLLRDCLSYFLNKPTLNS